MTWFAYWHGEPFTLATKSLCALTFLGTGTYRERIMAVKGKPVGHIRLNGVRATLLHRPVQAEDEEAWSRSALVHPANCLPLPSRFICPGGSLRGLWGGVGAEYYLLRTNLVELKTLWTRYGGLRLSVARVKGCGSGFYRGRVQSASTGLKSALNAKWLKVDDSALMMLINLGPLAYLGLLPDEEFTPEGVEALSRLYRSVRGVIKKTPRSVPKRSRAKGVTL